jgi:hypothetical protein
MEIKYKWMKSHSEGARRDFISFSQYQIIGLPPDHKIKSGIELIELRRMDDAIWESPKWNWQPSK